MTICGTKNYGQHPAIDIRDIHRLLKNNPSWNRTRLSKELCALWSWCNHKGQLKDMACRTLLLKMERNNLIVLPKSQCRKKTKISREQSFALIPHSDEKIEGKLKTFVPLKIIRTVPRSKDDALFNFLLAQYHYLGYKRTVGENMKYLIRDNQGNPLACFLFGSAAWKLISRDSFVGWTTQIREKNLCYITNNTRFLILPWVKIRNLASHILAKIALRISADWYDKYAHSLYLLETFVDKTRFRGTCYKAANWILLGQTKGRTRNDRDHTIEVPIKDVYVYPLAKRFREELCNDAR